VPLNNILLIITTEMRSVLRLLHLTKYITIIRDKLDRLCGRVGYEFKFDKALTELIRKGDTVWDIGANIGLYTMKFSDLVGSSSGYVYAFEPVPTCFHALQKNCIGKKNICLFNIALGKTETILPMNINVDPLGATHSLVCSSSNTVLQKVDVKVMSGDEIIRIRQASVPHIIKIDVEGFEEEVLLGLQSCLKNIKCRAVVCEIHFAILNDRGERFAPIRIQRMLQGLGFKVKWIDASHFGAYR